MSAACRGKVDPGAELAEILSTKGFANAVSDIGVGALLADTGLRGAIYM